MKKICTALLLFVFAISLSAQDDAISRFFDKYVEDEAFTVVYISPKMFQLVAKVETDDEDWEQTREIIKGLGGLRVLVGEDMDGKALYKEALTKVPVNEYEELLTVRDKDENVRIWVRESDGNIIDELLLLVGSSDEFVLLSLIGKIDLDQISNLAKTLDVEGVQHLDKIDNDSSKL